MNASAITRNISNALSIKCQHTSCQTLSFRLPTYVMLKGSSSDECQYLLAYLPPFVMENELSATKSTCKAFREIQRTDLNQCFAPSSYTNELPMEKHCCLFPEAQREDC